MELEIATIETNLFEHRQVKPYFINDCCFGEDFTEWLRQRLANSVGDGPTEAPAQWVISMTRPASLNIVRWLFSKPNPTTMEDLQARICVELGSTAGISVL